MDSKRKLLLHHQCQIRDELEDYIGKMLLMADKLRANLENVSGKGKKREKEMAIAEDGEEEVPVRKKPRQQIYKRDREKNPVSRGITIQG